MIVRIVKATEAANKTTKGECANVLKKIAASPVCGSAKWHFEMVNFHQILPWLAKFCSRFPKHVLNIALNTLPLTSTITHPLHSPVLSLNRVPGVVLCVHDRPVAVAICKTT